MVTCIEPLTENEAYSSYSLESCIAGCVRLMHIGTSKQQKEKITVYFYIQNAALEAVDDNDDKVNDASSPDEVEESGSGYSSEDDQLEEERQLQLALIEKDRVGLHSFV